METDNLGISIYSTSIIKDDVSSLYVALTGDQCALTNIRIAQEAGDDPFRAAGQRIIRTANHIVQPAGNRLRAVCALSVCRIS